MKRNHARAALLVSVATALTVSAASHACGASNPSSGLIHASFTREVVNLEDYAGRLGMEQPQGVRRPPLVEGELWYGAIFRQLPGDDVASRDHNVLFAVQFRELDAVSAWCDTNLNGDLSDDPRPTISLYPGARARRSFLAPLRWTARSGGRDIQIDRLVRVVVDLPESTGAAHGYRTQNVYGMLGTVRLNGEPRLALLYDANGDGLYRKGNSDGVFFDADNDRHFSIGVMSRDFGPFALPFSIGGNSYAVESIDAEGKDLTLRGLGPSVEQPAPGTGFPAPDFRYTDVQGRPVALSQLKGRTVIVYFWSSWCGGCKGHAEALRALYQRYDRSQLEILGVSNDSDRGAMQRFRTEHGHTWPTSFTGGFPAEDPVGRLYREMGSGVFYIVDPDGRLVAKEFEVDKVEEWLTRLIAKPTGALGSRP